MKKTITLIFFASITLFGVAGPVQELMKCAEIAFAKSDFAKAKGYYLDIISLHSATEAQVKDAKYNINICQEHINELHYSKSYNQAITLFKGKHFSQCKKECYKLLNFGKYKKQTYRLITQCNDSINAQLVAQQITDSIHHHNLLRAEYNAIIKDATAFYNKKLYFDAITICKKSFDSKFEPLEEPIPDWFERCIQIHQAQQRGEAITPEFASHLKYASSIYNVNSGIARIVTHCESNNNSETDTTHYISILGNEVLTLKGRFHDNYSDGLLVSDGFYDTLGTFHSKEDISWINFSKLGHIIYDFREFSDGMAPFKLLNNKWGYINKEFKVVITPQYDFVSAFHEGRAFVRKKGKWLIIDKDGNIILSKLYPAFSGSAHDGETGYAPTVNNSYYSDGKIWVQTNKYHNILVDKDGTLLLDYDDYDSSNILHTGSPLYEWTTFSNGLYIYLEKDKYGYMDASGKTVIAPIYDLAYRFHDGIAPVKHNGKWGFIDTFGNELIQPIFDDVCRRGFCEGVCGVKLNSKWGFIDKSGNWIISPIYDSPFNIKDGPIGSFHEGFAAVEFEGRLGYVDKFGNSTFDYQ